MDIIKYLKDSPLPWWEWTVGTNEVKFNDLKVTMLGYDPGDFRGKGYQAFTDLLHPEDYEAVMDSMRIVIEGKSDLYLTDYRIRSSDGSYHWYMDRGVALGRNREGAVTMLRGLVVDLGKEKSRKESLEALMDLLKSTARDSFTEGKQYISLCCQCRRIRKDEGEWIDSPSSIEEALSGLVSHSLCPDCLAALYPDFSDAVDQD